MDIIIFYCMIQHVNCMAGAYIFGFFWFLPSGCRLMSLFSLHRFKQVFLQFPLTDLVFSVCSHWSSRQTEPPDPCDWDRV